MTSNPVGAMVVVDGKEVGTTPLHLKLRRKKIHHVQIEKEGYEPFTLVINRKTSILPSLLGNYFIGGMAGGLLSQAILPEDSRSTFDFIPTNYILGVLFGWGAAMAIDFITGANYNLSPDNLVLSLSKRSEKSQSNLIMIDEELFQKIKWIRIRFENSDEEEIFNLN
jgi:hypothetical protein